MNNYFKTCQKCGSNLDPAESCECEEKLKKEIEQVNEFLKNNIVRDMDNYDQQIISLFIDKHGNIVAEFGEIDKDSENKG